MEHSNEIKPPKWAVAFLHWYCRPELLEDLQGDLNEYFDRNVKSRGLRKAKFIYIMDVLKFFRGYTLRKPKFINFLIQWIMIGSYVKTSGRNMVRNKLFSAINIVGLAISMSVGLLLIGLLSDLFSYDRFHQHRNRIYRVTSGYEYLGKSDNTLYASTSLRAGRLIQESIPGIDAVALLRRGFEGDVNSGEKIVPLKGMYANEGLMKVFTFPFLSGDPSTALINPFSLVLSESSAIKLFGETEALGKTVTLFGDKQFVVTGVMKEVPMFSHMRFDMLGSLSTREVTQKENKDEMKWDNIWNAYTYVLLPEHPDLETLQHNLDVASSTEDKTVRNTRIKLGLQPLDAIALGEQLNNQIGPVMDSSVIWILGVLSFVVILSACFNYTNLSIARSLRRSREVGIRKVIGALKGHVVQQFVVEAIIISLLALVMAFLLFILLKPYFLSIDPRLSIMLRLDLSPGVVVWFLLLAIGVGIVAGFLPAMFFSRINAIQVLKDVSSLRVFRSLTMRKALIVAQYMISLIFISATIIGFQQYRHFLSFDLGFSTENILNISLQNNKAELLQKELSELPEVVAISKSAMITSVGSYYGTRMKYNNPLDSTSVYFNRVDENYIPLHGHKLLAGRNFIAKPGQTIESEVIVNEETIRYFNIQNGDPHKALGEIVTVDRMKMEIIGVMKDYHYGKADSKITRVVFRYSPTEADYMNVKINSSDISATLDRIDKAWRKVDNVHPLEARFYDDEIERAYGEFSTMLKIIGFLAVLAIGIASMGLLGMVVFTTETRLKEISIRKVLGAREWRLIFLLSKGFLLLLAIAALVALPVTYLFFDKIALSTMVNHAPIAISDLLFGVLAVMAIAFLMIGLQTLKVARSNPAEVLKSE